jgi:uncharacterized membrane protein
MVPFLLLIGALLVFRCLGFVGIPFFATWQESAKAALSLMLLFTASAHFTPMKEDLIRMVPTSFPYPRQIIFVTGILELLGAVGLFIPATRAAAGFCLAALFVAMLPANINAASNQIPLRGKPPTALWPRVLMQIVYIGLACWVAL